MSLFSKLFGEKQPEEPSELPFMEHPAGQFETALQAIQSAMERLEEIDMAGRWITFSGQGQGHRPNSYYIVNVDYTHNKFNVGSAPINLKQLLEVTGFDRNDLEINFSSDGIVDMDNVDAHHRARFLDALFRQLGVKPFEGENDYAVGAEWIGAA